MAIRFRCSSCNRRLSVGDRKAGQAVRCPNCEAAVTVPNLADLAAAAAMAGEPPPVAPADDGVGMLQFLTHKPGEEPAAPPISVSPPAAAPRTAPAATADIDPNVLTIPRSVLYAQGVLIALVGCMAFGLGYWFASDSAPREAPAAAAPRGPVNVAGRMTYVKRGKSVPDAGAVVIVLPEGTSVDEKIAVAGLRPQDPAPERDFLAIRAIESLGGQYLRSDGEGNFSLTVPRAGKYHVLLVSHSARRSSDANPRPDDLAMLGRYFQFAPDLLEGRQYLCETLEFSADRELAHEFGADGR